MALQVFYDGGSHVIAETPADATVFLEEQMGEADADTEWKALPPTQRICIAVDDAGDICSTDDDHEALTLSAAEWIDRRGAGFLCSDSC